MFFQIVIVSAFAIVLGLAVCFAGFRLFVLLLPIWAFFAGFVATAQAIQELWGSGFLRTTSSWVFGLVIGALFAVAAYFFYYAAVVVLAATVGYEIGAGIFTAMGVNSGVLQFLLGLALAVALTCAVILLNLPKAFIVVLTAFAGASMALSGVLLALGRIPFVSFRWGLVGMFLHASWFWSLIYVAIAAVGIVVQTLLPSAYEIAGYGQAQTSFQAPTMDTARAPNEAVPAVPSSAQPTA